MASHSDRATAARAFVQALADHRDSLESPSTNLVQAISMFDDGIPTASGVKVNPETALRHIGVYAAVRVIAESVGSLPFPVYRRDGADRFVVGYADDYRAYLLNDEPNPYMTAESFWTTTIGHSNLWGNGYALHETDAAGNSVALWPLDPRTTSAYRTSEGQLYYATRLVTGETVAFEPWEIIHIRAFGTGDLGISPIGIARQAIGEQLAAEEYGGRFWQNDATPGGVITYEKKMNDADHAEALRRWRSAHEGVKRSHMVAILDNGAAWQSVGIPPGDAQFLDLRKWGIREMASLYRVPPHKIGDLEGTVTHASIEQQSIDFVQDSLRPWAVRTEQAVKRCMFPPFARDAQGRPKLTPDGAQRIFPTIDLDSLVRGDMATRYSAYAISRQWGFMSIDNVREKENMPAIGPDKGGDVYLQPLNMVPAGTDPGALAQAAVNARAFLASLEANGFDVKTPANASK